MFVWLCVACTFGLKCASGSADEADGHGNLAGTFQIRAGHDREAGEGRSDPRDMWNASDHTHHLLLLLLLFFVAVAKPIVDPSTHFVNTPPNAE